MSLQDALWFTYLMVQLRNRTWHLTAPPTINEDFIAWWHARLAQAQRHQQKGWNK